MTYPRITIVTPSYNQGHFLEDTILSVLGQNYPNLEYIIIDGASTDETQSIIRKYESNISYWVSEKDNGQSHAINKGFKRATGEILMWLNSDDMLLPNAFFHAAEMVLQYGEGIYYGNCIHFRERESGIESWGSNVIEWTQKHSLEHIDYIIQPSSFWSKSVYQKVGPFNEMLHFGFDWEWFIRAKIMGIKLSPFNKAISMYRFHDEHKSGTGGRKRQLELLKIYNQFNPDKGELFRLLMDEDKHFNSYKAKLIRKVFVLGRKPVSYGRMLKLMKQKKYKRFTEDEINYTCLML
jgi:glycosyltransferase involved in cell wall biosynthesis